MVRLPSGLASRLSLAWPAPTATWACPVGAGVTSMPTGPRRMTERRMSSSHSSRSSRNGSSNRSPPRSAQGPSGVPTSLVRSRTKTSAGSATSASSAAAADADLFSHLPRVAATPHLDLNGVALSSFYSLHRPLQVNGSLGASDPDGAVADFLDNGRLQGSSQSPDQVMDTLEDIIRALTGPAAPSDSRAGAAGRDASQGRSGSAQTVKRLVDSHVARQSPFKAPAPPQPVVLNRSKLFHDLQAAPRTAQDGTDSPALRATIVLSDQDGPGQGVEYEMSIPVDLADRLESSELENGAGDGSAGSGQPFMRRLLERALRASGGAVGTETGTDLFRLPYATISPAEASGLVASPTLRQPIWRNRLRNRLHRRIQMRLISVKRRRKLKIKKHKYKKLRQRTRTLRRKLDQL